MANWSCPYDLESMSQMNVIETKYAIIGAGLSGLTSAYQLWHSGMTDLVLLESRDRAGGRILTKGGIDFGATWFQGHHENVISMLEALQVSSFPQYSEGKSVLVYNTMSPPHLFENDPTSAPARRIQNGSFSLIDQLTQDLNNKIHLNCRVTQIVAESEGILIVSDHVSYRAEKVVVTLPPQIASEIRYIPELPIELTHTMNNTHTWMSNAIKVGITFHQPFWKEKGLSGTVIGQVGPVVELYDHCDADRQSFALMGFVNETLRELSDSQRKNTILSYLAQHLGDEVFDHLSYEEKDWSVDRHTSSETIRSLYMSPQYGNELFQQTFMENRLIFSGAETSPVYGGYMDGAIYSGLLSAGKCMS